MPVKVEVINDDFFPNKVNKKVCMQVPVIREWYGNNNDTDSDTQVMKKDDYNRLKNFKKICISR